ncbi:type II toxin-antitoxin system RelE/ParE family toxin [Devosia aquimaris]|uniref:type II toxin-antitoxin system RelE/ParE family toxin n=1 Tax=Devosia aquimaris TaxID=2866214 RepID=UPI001CD05B02|nr:type II toxin-antitoxin system RelE/ParE family toxin [Devosia sp. CJK-A8-3]
MAISAELGEALEQAVNDLVATGRYHSKSQVLREGVRRMPIGAYLVLHRVVAGTVQIVRVVHDGQDLGAQAKGD